MGTKLQIGKFIICLAGGDLSSVWVIQSRSGLVVSEAHAKQPPNTDKI